MPDAQHHTGSQGPCSLVLPRAGLLVSEAAGPTTLRGYRGARVGEQGPTSLPGSAPAPLPVG